MIILSEKDIQSLNRPVNPGFTLRLKEHILRVVRTRRERTQLASLTDEQLRDIGKTRIDALNEHNRSLLDLPDNRW